MGEVVFPVSVVDHRVVSPDEQRMQRVGGAAGVEVILSDRRAARIFPVGLNPQAQASW